MAETSISSYIIGIIIFSLFILGGMAMFSEMRTVDSTFATGDKFERFEGSFNQTGQLVTQIENMNNTVADLGGSEFGVFGVLNALIQGSWTLLKTLTGSLGFMTTAITGITMFGIPAWIPGLIALIPLVIIIFVIFSAIFQRKI